MSGARIIEGLKEALAGDFASVTIEGVQWIRASSADAIRAAEREAALRDLDETIAEDAAGHEGEVWIIERAKARIRARSTAKGGE